MGDELDGRKGEEEYLNPEGGSQITEDAVDPPSPQVEESNFDDESGSIPSPDPGVNGDPHLKTWSGERYDYHGVCDLVLLQNPLFRNKLGMEVHIRTKKTKMWSYVSSAVFRIGDHVLEVTGAGDEAKYWVDGVENPEELGDLSGYSISFEHVQKKQYKFVVTLDIGSVVIETFKDMVRVDFHDVAEKDFGKSLGLLGTFRKGERVGRDKMPIEDIYEFGQEWQVLASEDMLFHNVDGPQAPKKCINPVAKSGRRRLEEFSISQEDAKTACARVSPSDFDMCVFDVLATNDLEIPGAY